MIMLFIELFFLAMVVFGMVLIYKNTSYYKKLKKLRERYERLQHYRRSPKRWIGKTLIGRMVLETETKGGPAHYQVITKAESIFGIVEDAGKKSIKLNNKWYSLGCFPGSIFVDDVIGIDKNILEDWKFFE